MARRAGREEDLTVRLESASLPIAPDKLQKAVIELLDNALKFSRGGDPIGLAGSAADNAFVLCVSNQGRGMQPEQIARIGAHMQFERRSMSNRDRALAWRLPSA